MKFEDLGATWAESDSNARPVDLQAVRERAAGIDRAVRRRDRLETMVAAGLALLFAWIAVTTSSTMSAIGASIIVVACVVIPLRLRLARRRVPDRSMPVAVAVEAELEAIRAQQRLLASVAWWYLTPLGIGVILFFAGAPVPGALKVGYTVAVVVLYAWILRLNLNAVRRDLEPVAASLEHVLVSFRESNVKGGLSDAS